MISNELQHLEIKSLLALLYLIEEQNVGKAAERLFMSQPAMSRLLTRLRDAFDDPLFIRTSKGMIPTAKAASLEHPIRQMVEQMSHLNAKQAFDSSLSQRHFHLQATHYIAQAYVPFIAERLYQVAPNTSLETRTVGETSLIHSQEHNLDVVLCSGFIQVPSTYEKQRLGHETFYCVMSKSHPLAKKDAITLDDYLSYKHVLVNMGGGAKVFSDEALGDRSRERVFAFRTPYFLAALATVGKTDLLMSTSGLLSSRFAEQFGLVLKSLPYPFPDAHYYLCWPKVMEHDSASRWFRQLCAQVVQTHIPFPIETS